MSSPYRRSPSAPTARQPRDTGIVGDIIDQFSDKLAFYRELIQNSIDAETESIEVELQYEDSKKSLLVSVKDAGCGMSRDTIENQLVVLFRSTKEHDQGKIGKFGIGFVSVLAVSPSIVKVISSHKGIRHTLHLYPDLSFELFDSGKAKQSGTEVVLEIPMPLGAVEAFAHASHEALCRWCRHASVMISFEAWGPGSELLLRERIDRPLAIEDALVSVSEVSPDGHTKVVVGLLPGATVSCAFFNHGLLLHESTDRLVSRVSFVVQDARLGHTLSRDNVRRDEYYQRALFFVKQVAQWALLDQCATALRQALDSDSSTNAYSKLAEAISASEIGLDSKRWPAPLVSPIKNEQVASAFDVQSSGWQATGASPLTERLAMGAIPVLDRDRATHSGRNAAWIGGICPGLRFVENHLTLVTPESVSPSDLLMLDYLSSILDRGYRRPSKIIIASLVGAQDHLLAVAGDPFDAFLKPLYDDSWVLHTDARGANPFRMLMRPALVINSGSEAVKAARQKAEAEPYLAAEAIARLLLLGRDRLDIDTSEQLLTCGLDRLMAGKA